MTSGAAPRSRRPAHCYSSLNHISTTSGAVPRSDERRQGRGLIWISPGGLRTRRRYPAAPDEEPAIERPPEIGVDERRMHVRAYNYWVSLLAGRPYPSIQDVDPHKIEDFGPHSVLLDFSRDQRGSRDRLPRPGAARRMRARRRDPPDQRGAEPLAAVAAHRPLSPDHRQSRADRLRGRVRRPARPQHALSRHPDAASRRTARRSTSSTA